MLENTYQVSCLYCIDNIFYDNRENILTQVKVEHKEKRDLIMLRNRLVHYLNANKIVSDSIENYIPVLPEPISHHNACLKCPYLTTCSAVLR